MNDTQNMIFSNGLLSYKIRTKMKRTCRMCCALDGYVLRKARIEELISDISLANEGRIIVFAS